MRIGRMRIESPFKRALIRLQTVWLLLLGVMLSAGLVSFTQSSHAKTRGWLPFNRQLTKTEVAWVERTIARMTLAEKVGQLVSVDANAIFMNRESEEYRRLEHHIVDNKVGSVILFRSDVWATAILINRMQGMARVPLLVASDLEMGPGMRFDDTLWWAPNMAVAATGDTIWARRQGEATAREGRAIGINWVYAPVADVNNNPENPVINTRSYGEDPQLVASFVSAFIKGLQDGGAIATAKHFPGHGDTAIDSHIGMPVIDVSRERLERVELVPFRAAIASGVGAIMSAHIALPQIEPELAPPVRGLTDKERDSSEFLSLTESSTSQVTLPGTLSARIMTNLLRDDLKFRGIVTTDAMSMAGVAARFGPGAAALRAIKAGADLVLKSPDIDAAISALKLAVGRGEVSRIRIDESVRRILRAKAALGLNVRHSVRMEDVDRVVSSSASMAVAREIADRSITLVRNEKNLLPFDIGKQTRILNVTLTDDEDRAVMSPFLAELRRRATRVENISFDGRSQFGESDRARLRSLQTRSDLIILSLAIRARTGKASLGLPGIGGTLLQQLMESGLPLITISFGNPYLLQAIPNVPVYIAAYSIVPVSQRAAGRAVLGEIEINGRLPVSLPGLFARGHGLRLAKAATSSRTPNP